MNKWQLSYSGIYQDGAKIKTERDGTDVCLTVRREFNSEPQSFVLTDRQAVELAYALLRAIKQNGEDDEKSNN